MQVSFGSHFRFNLPGKQRYQDAGGGKEPNPSQKRQFAAKSVGDPPAKNLRAKVTVEKCTQNCALRRLVPHDVSLKKTLENSFVYNFVWFLLTLSAMQTIPMDKLNRIRNNKNTPKKLRRTRFNLQDQSNGGFFGAIELFSASIFHRKYYVIFSITKSELN